jgi:hypothetical protein
MLRQVLQGQESEAFSFVDEADLRRQNRRQRLTGFGNRVGWLFRIRVKKVAKQTGLGRAAVLICCYRHF